MDFPSCYDLPKSTLDRVCYVQAAPGSEFTIKVIYLGMDNLSNENAYCVSLYLDGNRATGRSFTSGGTGNAAVMEENLVHGYLEQPYFF
jgi:hypothetical protein